ncbi:hypothetical protein [Cupriavidus nantongensis]|uniref:hypothetical protein n=1 Tax=Cupriavidus nantongensis TaxID=1796606 RepID=UPI000A4A7EA1|nr:hypothetical protein [Cupriavidus nantongensis]
MSESITPAQCTDADWKLARKCGLFTATPGTNTWDAALGRFAESLRAGWTQRPQITAVDLLRAVIQRPDLTADQRERFVQDVLAGRDEIILAGSNFQTMAELLAASPSTIAATSASEQQAELVALPFAVLDALRFYANGSHFTLSDETAWDTVSGEPQNFWCDDAGTATVEDGSIAKAVLQGKAFDVEEPEPAIEGEAFTAPTVSASPAPFQTRVQPWMMECFGAQIAADQQERNHRFLEEALELVQACGATASEAHQLVDYIYGRPVGDKHQEAGGVMVTLAALCLAQGLDMDAAGEAELARIWTKVEQIRAKQAAKPKHSPLPEHVPSAAPAALTDDQREKVSEAVAGALGNAYDCMRVWSAWGMGTMGRDDFALVAEDSDRVAEIADAAIGAILAQAAPIASAPECSTCGGFVHVHDATGEYRGECQHCAVSASPSLPERDTSKPAEQQGLFRKFDVRRTDGCDAPGGKHHGCRYFVLDLDHDAHAPAALRAYAASCAATHPQLSTDLVREFGTPLPTRALSSLELKTVMCFDTPPCAGVAKPLNGKEQA